MKSDNMKTDKPGVVNDFSPDTVQGSHQDQYFSKLIL